METETYLNLGSEQFNSWVNEFENKYNKIEKTNVSTINSISSNEKIDLSDKELQSSDNEQDVEQYSDIEESSISEDDLATSNVFISHKENNKLIQNSVDTENSSYSNSRRLIYNRRFYNRNNSNSSKSDTINNVKDLKKDIIKKGDYTTESDKVNSKKTNKVISNKVISNKVISNKVQINEEKIMSLKELNNILPLENKIKLKEEILVENKSTQPANTTSRLRERALYRYIAMKRR